jgi:hypothetical protein
MYAASKKDTLEYGQMFGQILRLSNEDTDIIKKSSQLRRKKRDRMIEDEIETSQCKVRYY